MAPCKPGGCFCALLQLLIILLISSCCPSASPSDEPRRQIRLRHVSLPPFISRLPLIAKSDISALSQAPSRVVESNIADLQKPTIRSPENDVSHPLHAASYGASGTEEAEAAGVTSDEAPTKGLKIKSKKKASHFEKHGAHESISPKGDKSGKDLDVARRNAVAKGTLTLPLNNDGSADFAVAQETTHHTKKGREADGNTFVSFSSSIATSFVLTLFTEFGDRTFFIAAILSMRFPKSIVLFGTCLALIIQTVFSAIAGNLIHSLPSSVSSSSLLAFPVDCYAAALLLFVFGVIHIRAAFAPEAVDDINLTEELAPDATVDPNKYIQEATIANPALVNRNAVLQQTDLQNGLQGARMMNGLSSANQYSSNQRQWGSVEEKEGLKEALVTAALDPYQNDQGGFDESDGALTPTDASSSSPRCPRSLPPKSTTADSHPEILVTPSSLTQSAGGRLDGSEVTNDSSGKGSTFCEQPIERDSGSLTHYRELVETSDPHVDQVKDRSFSMALSAVEGGGEKAASRRRAKRRLSFNADYEEAQKATLSLTREAAEIRSYEIFKETFWLIFCAELGDKSMFSTVALAAAQNPFGVFIGSSIAHCIVTLVAIVAGSLLQAYISERLANIVGAILFLSFSFLSLLEGLERQHIKIWGHLMGAIGTHASLAHR